MTNKAKRRIGVTLGIIVSLLVIGYFAHHQALSAYALVPSFSLLAVYCFHALFSSMIYVLMELVFMKQPSRAGLYFLGAVFLKPVLFFAFFNEISSRLSLLQMFERYALLIPLFAFLLIESISIAILLNKTED